MRVSDNYLKTFENKIEVRDAILLRQSIIRNAVNMPELVKQSMNDEIEQFKEYYKVTFNEDFD